MTTYRIKEYAEAFIKRDALRKGPKARRLRLPWMSVPTDLQKRAIQRIAMHPRAAEIYGAFILMASVTARATERVDMGILADDEGHPYTPADLEEITGFPADSFAVAIEVLASPRVAWLLPVDAEVAGKIPEVAGKNGDSAGRKPEVAGNLPAERPILPADGTGRDGTGRDIGTAATSEEPKTPKQSKPEKRFTPPALIEVQAYCVERGNRVNPELWHDHYTANGWRVGRNPMKDWRSAVRTWERGTVAQVAPGSMPWESTAAIPLEMPLRSPDHDRLLVEVRQIIVRLGWETARDRLGFLPGKVTSERALILVLESNAPACSELIASETP